MSAEPSRLHPIRHGMYVLPSLFTAGTIAMGYYAVLQSIRGMITSDPACFDHAAIAIVLAGVFDGLDGRIARLTNTSSAFGRELDSLADVITFGVAPSLLAYLWGFHLLPQFLDHPEFRTKLVQLGAVGSFLFLGGGGSRLARFNIMVNPQPSNPGRPDKKYFVGMPIPAGAGVVAAVVHFTLGLPLGDPWMAIVALLLVLTVAYLMVST